MTASLAANDCPVQERGYLQACPRLEGGMVHGVGRREHPETRPPTKSTRPILLGKAVTHCEAAQLEHESCGQYAGSSGHYYLHTLDARTKMAVSEAMPVAMQRHYLEC